VVTCLRHFEALGDWQGAAWLLKHEGAALDALGDPGVDAELTAFRRRLRHALDHERVHGEGALLKRSHPANMCLAASLQCAREWPVGIRDALDKLWRHEPPDADRALWGAAAAAP
jgi:hypothetical protein